MKFNKQMDSGALLIPRAAFKISSFEPMKRPKSTRWTAQ